MEVISVKKSFHLKKKTFLKTFDGKSLNGGREVGFTFESLAYSQFQKIFDGKIFLNLNLKSILIINSIQNLVAVRCCIYEIPIGKSKLRFLELSF